MTNPARCRIEIGTRCRYGGENYTVTDAGAHRSVLWAMQRVAGRRRLRTAAHVIDDESLGAVSKSPARLAVSSPPRRFRAAAITKTATLAASATTVRERALLGADIVLPASVLSMVGASGSTVPWLGHGQTSPAITSDTGSTVGYRGSAAEPPATLLERVSIDGLRGTVSASLERASLRPVAWRRGEYPGPSKAMLHDREPTSISASSGSFAQMQRGLDEMVFCARVIEPSAHSLSVGSSLKIIVV